MRANGGGRRLAMQGTDGEGEGGGWLWQNGGGGVGMASNARGCAFFKPALLPFRVKR